jgi:hypothetical protein
MTRTTTAPTLGWREWVRLPELGIEAVKAKVDTGARTSALHAFEVDAHRRGGAPWVTFRIHPLQRDEHLVIDCEAPVVDVRRVRDSGGHVTERHVIGTRLAIGAHHFDVELTLTARDDMRFRMLLGRTAMRGRFLVDPGRSYLVGDRGPRGREG